MGCESQEKKKKTTNRYGNRKYCIFKCPRPKLKPSATDPYCFRCRDTGMGIALCKYLVSVPRLKVWNLFEPSLRPLCVRIFDVGDCSHSRRQESELWGGRHTRCPGRHVKLLSCLLGHCCELQFGARVVRVHQKPSAGFTGNTELWNSSTFRQ